MLELSKVAGRWGLISTNSTPIISLQMKWLLWFKAGAKSMDLESIRLVDEALCEFLESVRGWLIA